MPLLVANLIKLPPELRWEERITLSLILVAHQEDKMTVVNEDGVVMTVQTCKDGDYATFL